MSTLKNDITEKSVNEFVDSEGGMIGGDRNATSDSEIETGPVAKPFNDDSDYEKGISTTTDRASRYRQDIPWFAVYSYGATAGVARTVNLSENKPKTVVTKSQLEEEIKEDLVKKSKENRDVVDKAFNGKVEKVVDIINDTDLTPDQLVRIKKAVLDKLTKADA